MPLYQFFCTPCFEYYEIQIDLKTKEKLDRGKKNPNCPKCEKELTYLIAPPKTIKIN